MQFTLKDQIQEVEREITMREKVYLRQIMLKKMTREYADRKIELMRAILRTLQEAEINSNMERR